MFLVRLLISISSAAAVMVGADIVSAQTFPSKPIRIVTSGAGGGSDFDARIIAQGISGPLGQPVIVDNRGSGAVAAEIVSRSPPDGHSLLINGSALWILPIMRKAPYELADFSPISLLEWSVNLVAVHPSLPVKSVKELIDLARAKPGLLNYASTTVGSRPHLSAELLKSMAGVNIVHVPYKGNALAVAALISGEAQLFISDVGLLMPHVKSGKIRALAVTSAKPTALAPGMPTVADTGLPGYETTGMTGMYARANTPRQIINRLNQEIVKMLNRPDIRQRFLDSGLEVVASSPEELAAYMKADMSSMAKVIKEAGIKVE